MSRIILVFMLVSSSACSVIDTAYYESQQFIRSSGLVRSGAIVRSSRWVLPRNSRFYVARSSALADLGQEHSKLLSDVIGAALSANFSQVRSGVFPESLEMSLLSARGAAANFVIYPKLLIWDDKLGTWREILDSLRNDSSQQIVDGFGLDRALVQLVIIDVPTGSMVDLVQLEAGSGVFSLYGDRPELLLLPTLEEYFAKLAVTTG